MIKSQEDCFMSVRWISKLIANFDITVILVNLNAEGKQSKQQRQRQGRSTSQTTTFSRIRGRYLPFHRPGALGQQKRPAIRILQLGGPQPRPTRRLYRRHP